MSRFDFVMFDVKAAKDSAELKSRFQSLEARLDELIPVNGRSKCLAMTKLEEAFMWIGKALRDEVLSREGSTNV